MTTWFAHMSEAAFVDAADYAPVDLSHFAAIMGMTREQYGKKMKSAIGRGHMLDLLNESARDLFWDWIEDHRLYEEGTMFCTRFRLTLNKPHDLILFVKCETVLTNNDMKIKALDMKSAMECSPPEWAPDLPAREVMFCDLDTDPGGICHGEG